MTALRAPEVARRTPLAPQACRDVCRRVLDLVGEAHAQVEVSSGVRSSMRFARGDTHMASDIASDSIVLSMDRADRRASGLTDQLDDAGLRALVTAVVDLTRADRTPRPWPFLPPQVYPEGPQTFFESTVDAMAGEDQAAVFHRATDAAETAGLVAAGEVSVAATAKAVLNTEGLWAYKRSTWGEFSLTARTRSGTGSGWAWSGYEDWARVDVAEAITRAVSLAQRSADPVAIEPGRYTVILEPSAVATLIHPIIGSPTNYWSAETADRGGSVFSGDRVGTNKIGLQMMDRRLGMVSNIWDPEMPGSIIGGDWRPTPDPVTWFERGVLRNLAYFPDYAREKGREPVRNPGGVRLTVEGPPQTLDEMIAATQRGLWVNRLSHVALLNGRILLLTGTTRDGTFLIENGRITKPVKNFRFTESPFYAFNKLEAWGEPVRASRSVVAPRLKLRDFNLTSITDAV